MFFARKRIYMRKNDIRGRKTKAIEGITQKKYLALAHIRDGKNCYSAAAAIGNVFEVKGSST